MKRILVVILVASLHGCQQQPPSGLPPIPVRPQSPTETIERAVFSSASSPRLLLVSFYVHDRSTGERGGRLALWEVASGKQFWERDFPNDVIRPVSFLDGDAKFLILTVGSLEVWDTTSGKLLHRLHYAFRCGFVPSTDGRHVLDGKHMPPSESYYLEIWDALNVQLVRQIDVGEEVFCPCAWSSDGKLALSQTFSNQQELRETTLWDVTNGKVVQRFPRSEGWTWPQVLSSDGRFAVFGKFNGEEKDRNRSRSEYVLVVWDVASRKEISQLPFDEVPALPKVAFSADNRQLLVGTPSGSIQVWDVSQQKLLQTLSTPGPNDRSKPLSSYPVYCFAPQDNLAFVGCPSRYNTNGLPLHLTIWDVKTGKLVRNLDSLSFTKKH